MPRQNFFKPSLSLSPVAFAYVHPSSIASECVRTAWQIRSGKLQVLFFQGSSKTGVRVFSRMHFCPSTVLMSLASRFAGSLTTVQLCIASPCAFELASRILYRYGSVLGDTKLQSYGPHPCSITRGKTFDLIAPAVFH